MFRAVRPPTSESLYFRQKLIAEHLRELDAFGSHRTPNGNHHCKAVWPDGHKSERHVAHEPRPKPKTLSSVIMQAHSLAVIEASSIVTRASVHLGSSQASRLIIIGTWGQLNRPLARTHSSDHCCSLSWRTYAEPHVSPSSWHQLGPRLRPGSGRDGQDKGLSQQEEH